MNSFWPNMDARLLRAKLPASWTLRWMSTKGNVVDHRNFARPRWMSLKKVAKCRFQKRQDHKTRLKPLKPEWLAGEIAELPEREQIVLSLYYNDEMNLKEIGAIIGVSESRVSQILTKVVGKLRDRVAF